MNRILSRKSPPSKAWQTHRRQLCQLPIALACGLGAGLGAAPTQATESDEVRLALLIGNRHYPSPYDLPPVHKNVRDLRAALERWGFVVTEAVDLAPAALLQAIQSFGQLARQAPEDATVLFYFTGHGLQVEAENLMVGAGISPAHAADQLLRSSLQLTRDVIEQLPQRATGLSIAVIDACRTSLKEALQGGGLNQVEAPTGCLISFATAAGKPAIAPAVETQNTFYTGSLVKVLQQADGELSFPDLFRLVKRDVQQVMEAHPVAAIRQLAQVPFIAENAPRRSRLAPRSRAAAAPQAASAPAEPRPEDEARLLEALEQASWPADVRKLAEDYLQRYPQGRLRGRAEVMRDGASQAAEALQRRDVRLYRSAFNMTEASPSVVDDLRKAARGDKDAAARLGRLHTQRQTGAERSRYEGWMAYAAALGNGIASYELALHYRKVDQPLLAAQFESRARELGYTPPPSLDHLRK